MAKVSPLMIAPPMIFAGLVVLFLAGNMRDDPNALPSTREGGPVPEMTVTELAGFQPFDRGALEAPGVKLVNFWATWCAPCRAEHPNLEKLANEGIPVYGINYKDDPGAAAAFLAELGDPYAGIVADRVGRTGIEWGLYGVPETFVVDGTGTIVLRFAGPITERSLENRIRPAIEAATGR